MTAFAPTDVYRSFVREGDSGYDVWAVQIALNHSFQAGLVQDGVFGPKTKAAVERAQANLAVTIDGICGPETQWRWCRRECKRAEVSMTPAGVVQGICYGESNGIIPTATEVYPDGTRDVGPLQDNIDPANNALVEASFNVGAEAQKTAGIVHTAHANMLRLNASLTPEQAWRLAILTYNWPVAAEHLARGERKTWQYTVKRANGEVTGPFHLDDPQWWVEQYNISGVVTGMEWCEHYVNSKLRGPNGELLVPWWS